jgi:hypothetical protein
LASSFLGQDCGANFFQEWCGFRDASLSFKSGENWDRLYHQGIRLLDPFVRDNRIRIPDPQQNLQIKIRRDLSNANQFVAFVDAIGELDGVRCLIDWKTTSSRYVEKHRKDCCRLIAIALLLVDDWHSGSGVRGIRPQEPPPDPVFTDIHL